MAKKGTDSRERWAQQIAALEPSQTSARGRKAPLTAQRIVDTALQIVAEEDFDALTMRKVAGALDTGPASLYAHVHSKADLDSLLIGELCRRVAVPAPKPSRWQQQILEVCRELRDQYLQYPRISRAALASAPDNLDTLRLSEGMLGILISGKVPPQQAAWAIDAAFLYVSAYSFEASLRRGTDRALSRGEVLDRFAMLPPDLFPNTVAYADELTSGQGHERFDFTLELLFRGLTP